MSSPGLLPGGWRRRGVAGDRGQPPGAGSTAAPALVAHAPPDGYTLLINTSAQAYSAARAGELPYDPLRDFVPVAALTSQPYVLAVGAQSGITTIDELAAAASDRPGGIRFASARRRHRHPPRGGKAQSRPRHRRSAHAARSHGRHHRCDRRHGGRTQHIRDAADPARRCLPSGRRARPARGQHSAPLAPAAGRTAAHTRWRRRLRFPDLVRDLGASATPAGIVSTLARDITDTLATAELSQWLTQHDADPMHMSPAEFGAFVVSEAERAAVLLPTP